MSKWRGITRISAWPTKRPKIKSAKQLAAMRLIEEAADAVRNIHYTQIDRAKEITHGTQALWRDAIFMSLYGRMAVILTVDGQEYRPMAARQDVTDLIDSLGDTIGAILVRGPLYWEPLSPGEADQVLKSNGPGELPSWVAQEGGGGGKSWTLYAANGGASTDPNASKGMRQTSPVDMTISELNSLLSPTVGHEYQFSIWGVSGSTLGAKLGETAPFTIAATGKRYYVAPLLVPVDIPANTEFLTMVTVTNQTGTTSAQIHTGTPFDYGFPWSTLPSPVVLASATPTPGASLTPRSGTYTINFRYE